MRKPAGAIGEKNGENDLDRKRIGVVPAARRGGVPCAAIEIGLMGGRPCAPRRSERPGAPVVERSARAPLSGPAISGQKKARW
jgi:hypothetical protein